MERGKNKNGRIREEEKRMGQFLDKGLLMLARDVPRHQRAIRKKDS